MGDAGADASRLAAIFPWSDIRMAESQVKMQRLKFHVTGA